MSNIYDWYERDEIKTVGKDEKNVELITYYYKCKVCLEKMNDEQKFLAKRLLQEDKSVNEIAKTFNVHKATIYRLQDCKIL